ncbi:MAG: TolC family protein [Isosphaerales bacterium]
MRTPRFVVVCASAIGLLASLSPVRGENLQQAWSIALGVNQQVQSQQAESVAAGLNLAAARSARLPSLRSYTFNAFLTASPEVSTRSFFGTSATGGAAAGLAGTTITNSLPAAVPVLGPGQRDLPISIAYASLPLYTGGRILRNIDAAGAQVGVQRSEEFRTVLDLKLTVAESYIGVLRARKNLEVARSNVAQLDSFARDVRNRREQGLAIRSDELAALVSLANARLSLIQARTSLEAAWATLNRYLCRPPAQVVELDELTVFPATTDWKKLAEQALEDTSAPEAGNEDEVRELTQRAFRARPELVGLAEQARSLAAQADATRAGVLPQAGFTMAYAFIGNNNLTPQGIGAASFYLDWTITDGGASRRRAAALRQQEFAAHKHRADTAADVALQVRTRWLDLKQARRRLPVAHLTIDQAEENVKVVTDRYRQQLSTYTEVLDAESRRVQSLTNYYNAVYDESLALFRLRRAVGDL